MLELPTIMPDGTAFPFWDDVTEYGRVYHVAQEHSDASDDGPGTEERPFSKINRATRVLEPGENFLPSRVLFR